MSGVQLILLVVYIAANAWWLRFVLTDKTLYNWHLVIGFTVFLPLTVALVVGSVAWLAVTRLWGWLGREAS